MADPHDISGEPSQLKLGKNPAVFDKLGRTIQLKDILRKILPSIPDEFNVDAQYPFPIENPMFRNGGANALGDCVIAARAHMTRRFEGFEQSKLLPITDDDVIREYWKEAGGTGPKYDNGLEMLSSLKSWRNNGWNIGGRKLCCLTIGGQKYDIYAFAQISPSKPEEIKAAISLLNGAYVGLLLPISARDQFNNNQIWDVVPGPNGKPGSWGGHCVYQLEYKTLPNGKLIYTCVTWTKRQDMSQEFFEECCDESYAIVDNHDNFLIDSTVDIEKLTGFLNEIAK